MRYWTVTAVTMGVLAASACAGADNPTALSELQPVVEFELSSQVIETFDEIELRVRARDQNSAMVMKQALLEIHADGGSVRSIPLARDGEDYGAHVTFFTSGKHQLKFVGMPERHQLMMELGEHEIEVKRKHVIVGPYWVEIGVDPVPILEGSEARVDIVAFGLTSDSRPGTVMEGLTVMAELQAPDGNGSPLTITEKGAGEYEGRAVFEHAGTYELDIAIQTGGEMFSGGIALPVLPQEVAGAADEAPANAEGGKHGR